MNGLIHDDSVLGCFEVGSFIVARELVVVLELCFNKFETGT